MSDSNLKQKHDNVIEQLIKVNENDLKSKTELVKQLIEISRNLVNQNLINGVKNSDLATYINAKLIEYEIKFPRNENFYGFFKDSEKRSYGTNLISTLGRNDHEHDFVGDNFEKICECGDMIRLGKHYSLVPTKIETVEEQTPQQKTKQDKSETRPYHNETIDYFLRLSYLCSDYSNLINDQVKKYHKYETVAKAIEDEFKTKDLSKLMLEVKSLEAKLIHADKSSDARQKVGEFEKIKAYILQLTTHTVAHVAKIINITPKHMTNNVIRNISRSEKLLRWFKTLFVTCPDCKKEFGVDLFDWFNEQCERCNLGNDMKQPILLKSK
tara:strand:+ start:8683 stop:9660 length:978 start_codon:yes stop_codon:yes gene_type:complete